MSYLNNGAMVVWSFDDYIDLSLTQLSLEQPEKTDFPRKRLIIGGMSRMDQQVDISTSTAIVYTRAEQPDLGFLSEDSLGLASNRLDLLLGQPHVRAFILMKFR